MFCNVSSNRDLCVIRRFVGNVVSFIVKSWFWAVIIITFFFIFLIGWLSSW